MFPLPLFPTIPDDLESMDSRRSVQHMNTFMKNTLIRGVNNIYETACLVNNGKLAYDFLRYAITVLDMLRLHIEGDQMFFIRRNAQDTSLIDFLGIAGSYASEFSVLHDAVKDLQQKLQSWTTSPETYSCMNVRHSLETFAEPMLQSMASQRKLLGKDYMMKFSAEAELRDMITDMSVLLPFVLSHHDPATSAHWPSVAPEGLKLVPDFVNKDPMCWNFAPLDPITKQKRINRTLLSV